jgi:putative N6-adenine-specific DNA methylase
VAVEVSAKQSRLHHSENIAAAVFDGLREHMDGLGRPVHRSDDAPLRFFVRMFGDVCTISIDSSGELLYKRGYHAATAKAPIRETIASALLQAARWERFPLIADPLCGSGTLLIEAARMAAGRLPGAERNFAFMHWPAYNEAKWLRLKRQAVSEAARVPSVRLLASDIDEGGLAAAATNATAAGVAEFITFTKADCRRFNADRSLSARGLIIANPPWGKRIGSEQWVTALWRDFGRQLSAACQGWHFGLVVPDQALLRAAGLKPHQRFAFPSGGINVEFCVGKI